MSLDNRKAALLLYQEMFTVCARMIFSTAESFKKLSGSLGIIRGTGLSFGVRSEVAGC